MTESRAECTEWDGMGWDSLQLVWLGGGGLVIRMPDRDELVLKSEEKEGDRSCRAGKGCQVSFMSVSCCAVSMQVVQRAEKPTHVPRTGSVCRLQEVQR